MIMKIVQMDLRTTWRMKMSEEFIDEVKEAVEGEESDNKKF